MKNLEYPYMNTMLAAEERAEDLMSRMSPEEKLGQIQCYSEIHALGKKVHDIFPHGVGQVSCLIATMYPDKESVAGMVRKLQSEIMEAGEHHIPAVFHIETLCGTLLPQATSFPSGIGQASTWNPKLQQEMGRTIGKQTKAAGFRQALAPVLDISRDPRFGRQGETYGEDPTLAAAMGTAYVKGIQNDGDLKDGAAATSKHFLAFQAGEGGIHSARTAVPPRELREVYAKPFQAAITEGGLQSVMNSYASLDGEPVVGSPNILTKLLREEMEFDGCTVSDYGSVGQLCTVHKICDSLESAGQCALEAGMDMELPINESYSENLLTRIRDGRMDENVLNTAVKHALVEKFRLGLFEDPYPEDEEGLKAAFTDEKAHEISRQTARESMILLKNDGILPLETKGKKIAVIGYHAASARSLFGGYSFMAMKESSVGVQMTMAGVEIDGDSPVAESNAERKCYPGSQVSLEDCRVENLVKECYPGIRSVLDELKQSCPEAEITYAYGYPYAGNDESHFDEALSAAEQADIVILTIGGRYGWNMASTTGEGIDAMDIHIPKCQEQFIQKLAALDKPAIGVHFDGRPVSSDAADQYLNALVEAWTPGEHGAEAIVDVLLGRYNPDGRLPVCVAREAGQIPVYYGHVNGSSYDCGPSAAFNDYVDGERRPRYYFGYGLSYTTFKINHLRTDRETAGPGDILTVKIDIENTGSRAGSEVVQMYVKDQCASMVRPVKELAGFQKVFLNPGEKKTVVFEYRISQSAFLDREMRWKIEAGTMEILLGTSAEDICQKTEIHIPGDGYVNGAKRGFCAVSYVE